MGIRFVNEKHNMLYLDVDQRDTTNKEMKDGGKITLWERSDEHRVKYSEYGGLHQKWIFSVEEDAGNGRYILGTGLEDDRCLSSGDSGGSLCMRMEREETPPPRSKWILLKV